MTSRTAQDHISTSIVPINGETHAMLEYAETAEAQAKFEQARQEIDDDKGIVPNAEYFAELNQRISQRRKNGNAEEA